MSDLSEKIKSRGYWKVRILPFPFERERVKQLLRLEDIIGQSTVRLRGWDFPHTDQGGGIQRGEDYVWSDSQWSEYLEVWRLLQSGQFFDLCGMSEDWRDESVLWEAPAGWKKGALLGLFEALYRFTEIFEFAARLAMTEAAGDQFRVEVLLSGLQGRQLYMDDPHRSPLHRSRIAKIVDLPYDIDLSREELVANPRDLALRPTQRLYERFGLDMTLDALRAWQSELRGLSDGHLHG